MDSPYANSRKSYLFSFKQEVCNYYYANDSDLKTTVDKYKLPKSTIKGFIKTINRFHDSDHHYPHNSPYYQRRRLPYRSQSRLPDLDFALAEWVKEEYRKRKQCTRRRIKRHGMKLKRKFFEETGDVSYRDFNCSDGYITNMLKRNGMVIFFIHLLFIH